MNPMRRRSIPRNRKLFLAFAAGLVACAAVFTAAQYYLSTRTLVTEWDSKSAEYGRLLELAFQPFLVTNDRAGASRAFTAALSIPGLKSITVVDAQGTIVADSKDHGIGNRFSIPLDALRRALEQDADSNITWVETKDSVRTRFLLTPVKSHSADASSPPTTYGAILLGLDLSPLDRLVQSNLYYLLAVNGVSVVALLSMFWVALRFDLMKPLHLFEPVQLPASESPAGEELRSSENLSALSESVERMTRALQESEDFNRTTLNSLPAHVAILDREGLLLSVNAVWDQFSKEYGELFPSTGGGRINYLDVCRDSTKSYGPQTQDAVAGIRSVLNGSTAAFTLDYQPPLSSERRWFVLSVLPLKRQQGGAILVHLDITDRRRAEDALLRTMTDSERAKTRLDGVYATIPIGLMYLTPKLIIERVSRSMAKFQDRSVGEHLQQHVSHVLMPDRWGRLKPILEQVLQTRTACHGVEEVMADSRLPGGMRILLTHCDPDLNEDGTLRGIHVSSQDITAERQTQKEHELHLKELKAKNRELDQMAIRDPLTGLYNRRFFDEALTREWQQFQRSGEAFTVIIMDVDAFKAINDDYGHEAGDRGLQQVSTALKTNLRESDLIARVGGDEFAALLPRTDTEQSRQVIEKLCDVLHSLRLTTDERDIPMSLSVGAATVPGIPPVTSAAELLRVADKRMYEAKRLASARRADAG